MSQDFYGNSGGGFTTSPFSGSNTGSPGGGRAKTDLSHSLRPVCIAQLHQASQAHADSEWVLDGAELGQVAVVAHVVSITKQTTNTNYRLEDGFGSFEARHWSDEHGEDNKFGNIQPATYVRIIGYLKQYGGRRYINANHIRTCEDPHERFFHFLEATTVHLTLRHGPPGESGESSQAQGQTTVSASTSGARGTAASVYTASGSGGSGDPYPEYAHLSLIQRKILRAIIESPDHNEGVFVGAIAAAIGGGADMVTQISGALDDLMDAGHIYSTTDDSHFAVSR